jgi:hypothetical protein
MNVGGMLITYKKKSWPHAQQGTCCDDKTWASWELWYGLKLALLDVIMDLCEIGGTLGWSMGIGGFHIVIVTFETTQRLGGW